MQQADLKSNEKKMHHYIKAVKQLKKNSHLSNKSGHNLDYADNRYTIFKNKTIIKYLVVVWWFGGLVVVEENPPPPM